MKLKGQYENRWKYTIKIYKQIDITKTVRTETHHTKYLFQYLHINMPLHDYLMARTWWFCLNGSSLNVSESKIS